MVLRKWPGPGLRGDHRKLTRAGESAGSAVSFPAAQGTHATSGRSRMSRMGKARLSAAAPKEEASVRELTWRFFHFGITHNAAIIDASASSQLCSLSGFLAQMFGTGSAEGVRYLWENAPRHKVVAPQFMKDPGRQPLANAEAHDPPTWLSLPRPWAAE